MSDETPLQAVSIAINEVQLLLAEKRTSLSVMRTGIAVLALPLVGRERLDRDVQVLRHPTRAAVAGPAGHNQPGAGIAGGIPDPTGFPADAAITTI